MEKAVYIHGTTSSEQDRLRLLNRLTNPPFIEFLQLSDGLSVLEVGSGLGILAADIARTYPNAEVVGLEYSEEQLAQAKYDLNNLNFKQGDAHDMPFEDASFDVVYCRYLLEHVKDPLLVLREIYRVLKPGGKVFAQENNVPVQEFYPDCPIYDKVWQQFVTLQASLGGDGTIGKKLYALLRQTEFQEVKVSIAPQVHYYEDPDFVPWVDNIIGNIESGVTKLIENDLATKLEIEASIAELESLKNDPLGSVYFYWNQVTGIKK